MDAPRGEARGARRMLLPTIDVEEEDQREDSLLDFLGEGLSPIEERGAPGSVLGAQFSARSWSSCRALCSTTFACADALAAGEPLPPETQRRRHRQRRFLALAALVAASASATLIGMMRRQLGASSSSIAPSFSDRSGIGGGEADVGGAHERADDSHMLALLYDRGAAPKDLSSEVRKLAEKLPEVLNREDRFVEVSARILLKDEALLTSDESCESRPLASLGARSVDVLGIMNPKGERRVRAKLSSPEGWVSILDLASLYRYIDRDPWPANCTIAESPSSADYIVLQDETVVTSGSSSSSDIDRILNRNEVVRVVEVQHVKGERKRRGKLSDGGWVTLVYLDPCSEQLAPLPEKLSDDDDKKSKKSARRGSFLVVGDWGWDPKIHWNIMTRACQEHVALEMLRAFRELGDVRFIVNVGDSFYPHGVQSHDDPQWQQKWRDVFHEDLRSVMWYSVYGNHDLHMDKCACDPDIQSCAQLNADVHNHDLFYMPAPSYVVLHPDLNMEVIATDFNHIGDPGVCNFTTCPDACEQVLADRYVTGESLFYERLNQSEAKNLLIFSHYPTDYLVEKPGLIKAMKKDTRHDILYVGGHRHLTDKESTLSIAPHESWVVGGGGGMGCDGPQGFLVVEIDHDYQIHTRPVLLEPGICCA